MSKNTLINLAIAFLFLLLPMFVFNSLVFKHKLPSCMDVFTQHYPLRAYASRVLKAGKIPLWNPYTFSGVPFLANIQTAVFYPPNLILFTILPLSIAFGINLVLHFSVGGFFTYLYLRRISISRISSIFSGIIFMFSSFLFPKIVLPPILQASALIPLLFYVFEIALEKKDIRYTFLAGFCLAISVLSGYPQVVYGTVISLGIYGIWRILPVYIEKITRPVGKRKLAIKLVNFSLITCLLIITLIILTGGGTLSIFGRKMGFHTLRNPLSALLTLLALRFALIIKNIRINWKGLGIYLVLFVSIVWIAILVSAIQLLPSIELLKFCTQTQRSFSQLTSWTNVHALIKDLFLGSLKHGEVGTFIGTFPLMFIIVEIFVRNKSRRLNHFFSIFLFISFFILLIILKCSLLLKILYYIPGFRLFPFLCRYLSIFVFSQAVLAGIALDNLIIRAKMVNLRLFQNTNFSNIIKIFLLLITVIQLLYCNSYIMKFVDPEQYFQPSETINYLKQIHSPFRIFGVDRAYSYYWERREAIDLLIPNIALYYGILDAQGYDPIQLKMYKDYINMLNSGKKTRYPNDDVYHFAIISPSDSVLINLLNIRYILSKESIEGRNYKSVFKNKGVTVYLNTACLPRAFMVYKYCLNPDTQNSLHWIKDEIINVREVVILNQKRFKGKDATFSFPSWWKRSWDVSIKVESAGLKHGNYAKIYISGKQASLNKRGYNIVVVNPYTSDIERSASFDTCGSFNASKQMKEFINSIPEGRIVAVAVKDDASSFLTKEAALSLRNLGATGDLSDRNKHFRWSHSVIGMKGLKPGEALESYGLGPTAVSLPFSLPVVYRIDNDADDMVKSPEVKIIKWSPHKITIETDSKRDGFLVLSEIFYPGWKVYIDGKKGEILRANGIFRAVYVKRGQHLVQFTFSPFSFKLGLWISTLTLLIASIYSFFEKKNKKAQDIT